MAAEDIGDLYGATFPTTLEGIILVASWLSDHPISHEFTDRVRLPPDLEWSGTHRFAQDNWSRRPGGLWTIGTTIELRGPTIEAPCKLDFELEYDGQVLVRLPLWLVRPEYRQ